MSSRGCRHIKRGITRSFCHISGNWICYTRRDARTHTVILGWRDVAILAGERHASTGVDRSRGFARYYSEQGITLRPQWTLNGPFDSFTGHKQGEYLLGLNPKPQAFFAVNDFLAIGLMGAARDKGLVPGKDIVVVGFNDTPLAKELIVPLTSVYLPLAEMGQHAVELLLKRIKGETAESIILTPHLQVRASSALVCSAGRKMAARLLVRPECNANSIPILQSPTYNLMLMAFTLHLTALTIKP